MLDGGIFTTGALVDSEPIVELGSGFIRSPLGVSRLAGKTFKLLASTVSVLQRSIGNSHDASVDLALADSWYGLHISAPGGELPSPWDPLSASFATRDGSWIRTHANAPHHRKALLEALACHGNPSSVSAAIGGRDALELEADIVGRGGVASALRDAIEWRNSEAGSAVASEPLVARLDGTRWDGVSGWRPTPERPLSGIRVLDLTRVIAGPACTQVLAGLGADVLRVDPPGWDEPAVLPYVMWDKRSSRLDARSADGRARLLDLLSGADILVHGYRGGALDDLGLGDDVRWAARPGLIEVSERAYGWSGPWAERRGFDSVVQFATGLSSTNATAVGAPEPVALPVQALDWTTGYLAAAAAITGLTDRSVGGTGSVWRLSLARTAVALTEIAPVEGSSNSAVAPEGLPHTIRSTAHGRLQLNRSPFRVGAAELHFDRLTPQLGLDQAVWL